MTKRSILSLLSAFISLLTPLSHAASPHDGDARVTALFRSYLDASFALQPMAATRLGDHRFDHQLDDLSAAARAKWAQLDRATLERLRKEIKPESLSPAGRLDFQIFEQNLVKSLWLFENTHPFEEDPRTYNEYINDSVFLLLTQSTLPREVNISNCIARMGQMGQLIQAATNNLRHPPRTWIDTAIRQNRGAIQFYETDLFEIAGRTPQSAALRNAAAKVAGLLQTYQRFLEDDLARRATGQWRIGKDKFYAKLEIELDSGMNADQVLADAKSEFERVQSEMYVVARQLWSRYFPKTALPPDDPDGRRSTVQQVLSEIAKDHTTSKSLVRDVRKTVSTISQFIDRAGILKLPQPDRCRIIEMPEFQRGNSTAYMNSPPPLDPEATGFYAVSPPPKDWDDARVRSYFEEYNNSMLQILTIHEAYPGHYVQFEYANRNPSLIRKVLQSGVYVEGWAVYTEQMMLDQGYGAGDLPLRLTQLKFYLRAVANAMLDHQMHCTEMTDAEALAFLTRDAYQSEGEARLKVIRAQQSSVQLSTYFVGRMAHYRLRQAIQRELGNRFDLSRYHEAVLSQAAVPVKYLPDLVRAALKDRTEARR